MAERKGKSGSGPVMVAEVRAARLGDGAFSAFSVGGASRRSFTSSSCNGRTSAFLDADLGGKRSSLRSGPFSVFGSSFDACSLNWVSLPPPKFRGEGLADDAAGGGDNVPSVSADGERSVS